VAKVGFGAYRISIKSKNHEQALRHALDLGCAVIDTSANYTNGESELLIGKVLKDVVTRPLLISKVGYIQGANLVIVEDNPALQKEMVYLDDNLKHSIHPNFIADQLERSLQRLGVNSIDVYLLHNPEYYLKSDKATKEEYYRRLKQAFLFLEEKVKEGKIKSYGISSNTFVLPREDLESTDLELVYAQLSDIPEHHFRYIQFPLNLMELGALERQFDGLHLIERAKELGFKTIINRPLNAFTQNGLMRLANYEIASELTTDYAHEQFNTLITALVKKWEEVKDEGDEKLFEIPLMQQFSEIWYKQISPDAVDHVFRNYFFPFIAQIWGENLSAKESTPFYDLYDLAVSWNLNFFRQL
jgi:aryl-alcohol dehydrogenase-like predicted oxidoreductase